MSCFPASAMSAGPPSRSPCRGAAWSAARPCRGGTTSPDQIIQILMIIMIIIIRRRIRIRIVIIVIVIMIIIIMMMVIMIILCRGGRRSPDPIPEWTRHVLSAAR